VRWADSGNNKTLFGVHFADARTGWAVGARGTIVATRDGGATWDRGSGWAPQQSGTDKALFGVHFADARTGWAVGDGGTMLRAGPPIYAPLIDEPKVVPQDLSALDVSFHVKADSGADVTAASVWARVREAQWTPLGAATKSGDGRWNLTWKQPEKLARSGDKIEYQVEPDDGGPLARWRGGLSPRTRARDSRLTG